MYKAIFLNFLKENVVDKKHYKILSDNFSQIINFDKSFRREGNVLLLNNVLRDFVYLGLNDNEYQFGLRLEDNKLVYNNSLEVDKGIAHKEQKILTASLTDCYIVNPQFNMDLVPEQKIREVLFNRQDLSLESQLKDCNLSCFISKANLDEGNISNKELFLVVSEMYR